MYAPPAIACAEERMRVAPSGRAGGRFQARPATVFIGMGVAAIAFLIVLSVAVPLGGPGIDSRPAVALMPDATGTVRYLPEMGILDRAPVAELVQSGYFRTTDLNREFRRGFIELSVPEVQEPIFFAALILAENRGWTAMPLPPDLHEVSYYTDVDLAITAEDYNRSTTLLASIETDVNLEQDTFAIDVTPFVLQHQGGSLGFRVKLVAEPTFEQEGSLGSGFTAWFLLAPTASSAVRYVQDDIRTSAQDGLISEADATNLTAILDTALRGINAGDEDAAAAEFDSFAAGAMALADSGNLSGQLAKRWIAITDLTAAGLLE